MSLSAVVLPKKHIQVGETGFDVRGLSFHDVGELMANNKDELTELVRLYFKTSDKEGEDLLGGSSGMEFIKQVVTTIPTLVAKVIAIASDEPDQEKKVSQLPAPIQLEALMAVGQATFQDEDGLKKFVENIVIMLGTLSISDQEPPTSDLPSGTLFSDDK